ncbi:hypothetical protein FACS189459_2230 [Bacilli bacterium]|nr:hypothetical protein FACS189459_2230 [Bacilli bacterium]
MLSKNTNIHHNNFKFTWNLFFQLLLITAFIFGIESISYFVIGEYVGRVYGLKNTIDLQLPVDRLIP